MKIYLTLSAIPELAALPPSERRVAYHTCAKYAARHWQVFVGTAIGFMIGAGMGSSVLYGVLEWHPFPRLPTYFTGGFLCGAIIVGVTSYFRELFIANYIRPHLRDYLAHGDAAAAGNGPPTP